MADALARKVANPDDEVPLAAHFSQYDAASIIAVLAACGAFSTSQHRLQVLAWCSGTLN